LTGRLSYVLRVRDTGAATGTALAGDGTRSIPGWEAVPLGIAAPRSHVCVCCLSFRGPGLSRNGLSYCLPCWQARRDGTECAHPQAASA